MPMSVVSLADQPLTIRRMKSCRATRLRHCSGFPLFRPCAWATIERLDEVADVALEGVSKSKKHRQSGEHHAAFDVADEWYVRVAALGELRLRQASLEPKLSQMRTENLPCFRCLRHSRTLTNALRLTYLFI